ncbi:Signal transduction histidine-protein kinase BarA [Thalassocella blandensis]|nr:Signal transduction histidine-protein kinase BarA [Thalassocella blandensis]
MLKRQYVHAGVMLIFYAFISADKFVKSLKIIRVRRALLCQRELYFDIEPLMTIEGAHYTIPLSRLNAYWKPYRKFELVMIPPILPDNEAERIKALLDTGLLDSLPEERFDRLTRLAQFMFKVPYALVSLVDADRQWFKSKQGLDACETSREVSFCGHAILGDEIFEVANALEDNRFSDNPLVAGPPNIRFYAGAPISTADGYRIGTLCIIDDKPRQLNSDDRKALLDLAQCVSMEISSHLEKALTEERRRLSDLIEGTRIGVWEWNVQTGEAMFNERWAEISGHSLEELQPVNIHTWFGIAHPEDLKRARIELDKCFQREKDVVDMDLRVKHKQGHWVWVNNRGKVVRWTNKGEPQLMSGTLSDISDKKTAEQAIRDYTDFQNLIFENIPALIFVKDKDFRIVEANSHFLAVYPENMRGNIIGRTTVEEFNEADAEEFLREDRKAFELGFSEKEETITFPNGQRRTLWTKKVRFMNQDHEPFLLGVSTDITDRKTEELQREELRSRLSLATDSAGIGIWVWDLANNQLEWDKNMFHQYGMDPSRFSGVYSEWQSAWHPDDQDGIHHKICQALSGEKEFNTSFRIRWPMGDVIHVQVSAFVERDEFGKPLRMIGTSWDITNQKRTEQALIRAKVDAEVATKAKSDFLANMSHEIRTPINGVLGMLHLVSKNAEDKEQKRRLQLAEQSAATLLTIINDILDFSKIEAGRLEFEAIEFDLLRLISSIAEANAHAAHTKGLHIIVDAVGIQERLVIGDPNRLKQIFNNLLSNAIKFTEAGEIVLRAELKSGRTDGWQLVCSVQDNGIGIDDEKMRRLFEPFTQADSSTTRHFGGTGLGLSIVKHLCEKMGGKISAKSKAGEGSCFSFYINLGSKTPTATATAWFPPDCKPVKILVLDDFDASRDVIARQLTTWGQQVFIASSWSELTALCTREPHIEFDLAYITQTLLPEKNHEVKQKIDLPCLGHAKVIMIASSMESIEDLHLGEAGLDNSFPMPVTPSDLFDSLMSCFNLSEHQLPGGGLADQKNAQASDVIFPQGGNVLLVEDNSINQEVARTILEDMGLTVTCANNGAQAIAILQQHEKLKLAPFELILMDCQMPEMDGYDATRAIRTGLAGEYYKKAPIIALTANAMKGDAEKCAEAGMDSHLAKPIIVEELIEKLQHFLQAAQLAERSDGNTASAEDTSLNSQENVIDSWDKNALSRRMKGNLVRLQKLLNIFLSEKEERHALIGQLKASLDLEQISQFAHVIRGNAANLSCHKLTAIASNTEMAAIENRREELPEFLTQLDRELEQVYKLFNAFLLSRQTGSVDGIA